MTFDALHEQIFANLRWRNPQSDNWGRRHPKLFRAGRLGIDTVSHAQGWRREEAIDYLVATLNRPAESVPAEVEQSIVWPG